MTDKDITKRKIDEYEGCYIYDVTDLDGADFADLVNYLEKSETPYKLRGLHGDQHEQYYKLLTWT